VLAQVPRRKLFFRSAGRRRFHGRNAVAFETAFLVEKVVVGLLLLTVTAISQKGIGFGHDGECMIDLLSSSNRDSSADSTAAATIQKSRKSPQSTTTSRILLGSTVCGETSNRIFVRPPMNLEFQKKGNYCGRKKERKGSFETGVKDLR